MNYPSFRDDLAFSQEPNRNALIDEYCKEFFGAMGNVVEVRNVEDLAEQKKGYDRLVVLDTDEFFRVEIKFDRYGNTGNFVVELWSDLNRKKGWLFTSRCNYLLYHFTNTHITHMLPMPLLRRAWAENEKEWRSIYPEHIKENVGWTTVFILIPIEVLKSAMTDAMIHNHVERWEVG